jgi:tetratricopeptide (TPR) repeat protein
MSQLQRLKHEARRAEQRSNWDRAIELYKDAIRLDEKGGGSTSDIAIYNRVGDIYLRRGETGAAVEYYEQAIDRYASHDLTTSAIALCNKILRIAPDHDEVYRKLGRLHASNGLIAEARAAFLEFASRIERQDRAAEALEAVQEFVDLTGDEEVRVPFATSLHEKGMTAEAVAQLRLVYDVRLEKGSDAEAIRRRMLELDPQADPARAQEPPAAPPAAASGAAAGPVSGAPAPGKGHVQLGRLVGEALGSEAAALQFDPEMPVFDLDSSAGTEMNSLLAEVVPELGYHELAAVLARFRTQVRDIVEESDVDVHYDLGLAYMNMGLLGEAIREFRDAMESPAHLSAAHAMIGECLARAAAEVAPPQAAASPATAVHAAATSPEPATAPGPAVDETPAKEALIEVTLRPEGVQTPAEVTRQPEGAAGPEEREAVEAPQKDAGLAGVLFKARLARHRARQAASENRTDHEAHLELGLAYLDMALAVEAFGDLQVAARGPSAVSARALDALGEIAVRAEFDVEVRVSALRIVHESGRAEDALAVAVPFYRQLAGKGPEAEELLQLIRAIDPTAEQLIEETESEPQGMVEAEPVSAAGPDLDSESLVELDEIFEELDVEQVEPGPTAPEPTEAVSGREVATAETAVTPVGLPGAEGDAIFEGALAALASGRTEEATADLYRALDLFETARRIKRASEVVETLLEINPEDVVLHHQRAEYAIMTNDRQGLIEAYLDLAACLRRQQAPRAARTVYGRMLDVDPDNVDARTAIAQLDREEMAGERLRQVSPVPTAALELDESLQPETRPTSEDSGVQDFDDMLRDLKQETAERDSQPPSGDHESHYELALAFRQMGMWEEAARELQIAVGGMEEPLPAYEALGECLIELERYEVARRVLEEAERQASWPEVDKLGLLYFLGVASQEGGDLQSAYEYLVRVCAVDITYRDAADRLSSLSS